ncbi:MAG: hypothetical protein ACLQBL_30950 [Polyangiaceae bacterium]|jgi:hypothetical protein
MAMRLRRSGAVLVVLAAMSAVACTDKAKLSEKEANANVDALVAIADADVGQIERGLPLGAGKLSSLWANGADAHQDLRAVRAALVRMRREVPDLTIAKSTFFAVADAQGIAIRNDLEEDAMAGTALLPLFPGLAKAEAGSYVTTTGAFPGPPLPSGPDKDWLAAVPIKKDDGSVAGILLTGWTFRRFAYHLQEQLQHDLSQAQGNAKLPVLYVMVFDKSGVYGAPQTPHVNEDAIAHLDPVAKTAAGRAHGTLTITDRDFGWVAARLPKLGSDIGIAVLRSEL